MKVLFAVHGMGVQHPGWADAAIAQLDQLAGLYPQTAALRPLTGHLRIEQLVYDSVFRAQVDAWARSTQELEQFGRQNNVAVPEVLDWLRGASNLERNYFWTHVVDVLLYRFFPIIRQNVRVRVMRDIAAVLTPLMAGGNAVDATVFGYSMGTAVAHDALAELATRPLDGSAAFNAGNFRFESLVMVANVGKILETDYKVYRSAVHPTTPALPNGYCGTYLNFRNVFDPFPWPASFRPGWPERYFKSVDKLDHIQQFNTHALEHYLAHPAVHIRILHALFGPRIPPGAVARAIADFDKYPLVTRCQAVLDAFKARIEALLRALDQDPTPTRLITAGAEFLAAAEEARNACL